MKTYRNSIIVIFFIILFSFFIILIASCGSSNKATVTPTPIWYENSDGSIDTLDAERLQKVVPFTIVFPTYLPEDLKSYSPDLSKWTGQYSETVVRIRYTSSTGSGDVDIEEVNLFKEWAPDKDAGYTYLDIAGIRVLEQKVSDYILQSGQQVLVYKLAYTWNQDNIDFSVVVTRYDQTEGRKIVESMINQ